MGTLWLYSALRFGLFFGLWGIFYLLGVGWFLGALIALALSIPLSLVLLRKPRAALSQTIEARLEAHQHKRADFDARLDGDGEDPASS